MKLLGEGIGQLRVFLLFLALGAVVGFLYTLGVKLTKSRVATFIFDLLFGLAAVVALFWANLRYNNGQARLFVFVALFAGGMFAYFICRKPLDKLGKVVYNRLTSRTGRKDNGTTVLQKVNIDIDSGCDFDCSNPSLHSTDNSVANGIVKQ